MEKRKRMNFILDLDQTIISGEVLQEEEEEDEDDEEEIYDIESNKTKAINFDFQNMENYYVIFERPKLQKFLDFLFSNFNVSVWTAGSKDYCTFITEKIVLANKPERKLDYVFWSYHCRVSSKIGKGSKDLSLLWNYYKLPGFDKENTIILDDYDHVYETNVNNTIISPPFYFTEKGSENDKFLDVLVEDLKSLLKGVEKNEKMSDLLEKINRKNVKQIPFKK